jgi:hypothetical protein
MHGGRVMVVFGVLAGCTPRASAPANHPVTASSCPACECKCECETASGAAVDPYERDELFASATRKASQRDGEGCLADLDRAKALDGRPRFDSENPESPYAHARAQCLMLSGQCDAGKKLARSAMEQTTLAQWGADHIDRAIESYTSMYCQGRMSDRDALLQSLMELQRGAYMVKKDVRFCDSHYDRVKRLRTRVKPKDDDDMQIVNLDRGLMSTAPVCYQRAGDCKKAWAVFREVALVALPEVYAKMAGGQREQSLRLSFESIVSKCKDP